MKGPFQGRTTYHKTSHPHLIGSFFHPGDKEGMQIESIDLNRHEMNSSMRPNSKSKVNS